MGVVILHIVFYLLQLGFHSVAVVGRLVQYKNGRNNTQNYTKTIQKHRFTEQKTKIQNKKHKIILKNQSRVIRK